MSKRLCHSKKVRFKQKQRPFSKAANPPLSGKTG